jgi:hypothetical protein
MGSNISNTLRKELQPRRMQYAINMIEKAGCTITFQDDKEIIFQYKDERINFFPYTGWATGKSIKDGRGINNLIKQLV